jgi:PKD repeat protein
VVNVKQRLLLMLLVLLLMALGSCGSTEPLPVSAVASPANPGTESCNPPSQVELEQLLLAELARLGVDPQHAPAIAPAEASAVFDLRAEYIDEDPDDSVPPTGVSLTWTFQSIGDYNMDGIVGINDLTPLGQYWLKHVSYDNPLLHDGITYWPSGSPLDDGGVTGDDPPAAGSAAENWRTALVDGNRDSLITLNDITPIGQYYGVRLGGYVVYRRIVGEEGFAQVAIAEHPQSWDPRRPLVYSHADEFTVEDDYEYMIRPYGTETAELGPDSNIALAVPASEHEYPMVELLAVPIQGLVPLAVDFTATAAAAPPATIVSYEWDFTGEGEYEPATIDPAAQHLYEEAGQYLARVRVTDSDGNTALAGALITAGSYPVAELVAEPPGGEVPMTVLLDASDSTSAIGEIERFEWDLDGDATFELDTGLIAQQAAEFLDPGEVTIGVRVTDAIGLTDVKYLILEFADDYEEIEPNGGYDRATVMGDLALGVERTWRGNIGADGYNGDESDWLQFAVAGGCSADITLNTNGAGVRLALRLVDVDGFSTLAELPAVTGSAQFTRGLRGAGSYFVHVANANTTTGLNYDYEISIVLAELTYDEVEDNDTPGAANDLGTLAVSLAPGLWGSLGPEGLDGDDDDWYRFSLAQSLQTAVTLDFFHHEADLELAMYDHTGTVLLGVSEGVTNQEEIELALEGGEYLVRCYRRSGGTANYQLAISISY